MANSQYEYVKQFEQPDRLLPNTWIVIRIDGRGFTKFANKYRFEKPNDRRALELMNAAAKAVMTELPDITIAYGGTLASDKNEILFSEFGINYNNEPEIYKKGSVVFRDENKYELVEPGTHNPTVEADSLAKPVQQSKSQAEKDKKRRSKARIVVEHVDIIKPDFWERRPWLLSNKPGKIPKEP
ncbi:79a88d70-ead7-4ebe-a495-61ed251878e6 [Thermothielavioides terrestris]|uniref:tRNA(His) guanylyltransferase n=1 Tax=Thermothielavioides terrestris TaxID=2587410 RepID=A0A3S5CVM2_9PEZI|nr:79a88d70-ead7-4ebe-a495-61ed251878e6 [Thermothielavioides terrestris]